jgi:hypothetical protein
MLGHGRAISEILKLRKRALISAIAAIIGEAARKTGRPREDFEVEEISKERFDKLTRFLG